jgi:hypothetical protein
MSQLIIEQNILFLKERQTVTVIVAPPQQVPTILTEAAHKRGTNNFYLEKLMSSDRANIRTRQRREGDLFCQKVNIPVFS